jgi:preprotein translocase subunit Sss1
MRWTKLYVLLALTVCAVGGIVFFVAGNAAYRERINSSTERRPATERTTTPSVHNYKHVLARLEAERLRLSSRFQTASPTDRTAVIAEARTLITKSIYEDLFPAWYGTGWDFNGTSEVPQQGKIACGYFVSTVLRDAGWNVERVRLAQQASENIILSLTTDPFVKRFRRVPIGEFVNAVKESGAGIYIVGLDVHVGFIVNTGSDVYFIHSSYAEPYVVLKEKAMESGILASSKYRVLGNISADERLIRDWLTGKAIPTKR